MNNPDTATRFWLIRHALVDPESLSILYGTLDVPLCATTRTADAPRYAALATRLPHDAVWLVTPLSRTRLTADSIMEAGYGRISADVEPALIEQDFGAWQGLPMRDFVNRPNQHPFWPVGGDEAPPDGETFAAMRDRVGEALERLAQVHAGRNIIAISHGGAIRAAIAHALGLSAHQALSLAVDNLSITRIERHRKAWRFVSLNEQLSI
ncbi:MAG TPA: histidine phosphatase family protein [Acidiphilium sp.]